MGAEADAVCVAGHWERSEERTNRRNAYRVRDWDTRTGTVVLSIPKQRSGSYFPDWLLERSRRAEAAVVTVVTTSDLLGVSTRRMDKLVETWALPACPSRRFGDGQVPRRPARGVPHPPTGRRPPHVRGPNTLQGHPWCPAAGGLSPRPSRKNETSNSTAPAAGARVGARRPSMPSGTGTATPPNEPSTSSRATAVSRLVMTNARTSTRAPSTSPASESGSATPYKIYGTRPITYCAGARLGRCRPLPPQVPPGQPGDTARYPHIYPAHDPPR